MTPPGSQQGHPRQGLAVLLWNPQALSLHLFVYHTALELADDVFSPYPVCELEGMGCVLFISVSQAPSTRPGTRYIGPQLVFVEWVSKRECRNSGLGSAGGSIETSPTELQEPGKASREEERKLML